jgi:hypothetical protein
VFKYGVTDLLNIFKWCEQTWISVYEWFRCYHCITDHMVEGDNDMNGNETMTIFVIVCQYNVLTICCIILVSGYLNRATVYCSCKEDFKLTLGEAKTAHKNKHYGIFI